MRIPQHFGTLSQGPQGYWLNAASPKDPFFSLRSPHFKEGQWRSKGPAWPFRVTTRIGWEHSSPRAAPRFSQPWPAPSATLLLGGPMLVTLDGCSPTLLTGPVLTGVPCGAPRSLKSTASPWRALGNSACSSRDQAEPPQSLLPGASAPLPLQGESCFIIPSLL